MTSNTFSFEYVVSMVIVIITCNNLIKSNPNMNTAVIVIAGLLTGYVSLIILERLFPYLNHTGQKILQYYKYQFMNHYSNLGYMHVWPPLLAVLILFVVLLYNRSLG